jgi:membrane protein implicated in regulation of membrane protease activity
VKVGGEEWSAISQNNLKIKIGKKVTVQKIEGNKLIVLEIEKEKEEE